MDRRQIKTRKAIFNAFVSLLSKKSFNSITIREIIDKANVGRATFYAHFETKEFLLEGLCKELFDHLFEAQEGSPKAHSHVFDCDKNDNSFVHLLYHLKNDDNHLIKLLTCENNQPFFDYFKKNVAQMIKRNLSYFESKISQAVPSDFYLNHLSCTFVETVKWWLANDRNLSPEEVIGYFFAVI